MLTYMASCGDQTCTKFDSTTAKWFKIQQVGQNSDGNWAQADISSFFAILFILSPVLTLFSVCLVAGAPASINLPSNIAPGSYLIRHEIIALQLAVSIGGAEFYPSCSQLTIGGNGTGKPQENELVSFPGAYRDNDPGIFVPNVYNGNLDYQFPGPPIASFVSSSSNPTPSSHPTGGNSSTTIPTTSQPTPSGSPSSCKLKSRVVGGSVTSNRRSLRRSDSINVKYHPRHMSRVMRNVIFGNTY